LNTQRAQLCARSAAMLLVAALATAAAQQNPPPAQTSTSSAMDGSSIHSAQQMSREAEQKKAISGKDRRRASKLFIEATKLFEKRQFDTAMRDYEKATALDPENANYSAAAAVARSHAVEELIQVAAKARIQRDSPAERAALQRAAELDPKNEQVAEHLHAMADDSVAAQPKGIYEQAANSLGEAPILTPVEGKHSFHLRSDRRQLIQTVLRSYGIEAAVDQSVSGAPVKLDLDDATFDQATQAVSMVTTTFMVPLDSHRAVVARDTRENRQQFTRLELETVYLGGLTAAEMTEIGNLARNVFQAPQVAVDPTAGTLTVRASSNTLNAINDTLRRLLDGRSQVMLEVRLIQLAHTNQRNIGPRLPQQITAFNVFAEEQAILNANQQLVQEIISSGLAAPGDTLAILGILLASGQVSSSIFQNGIVLVGGGLTLTGITPAPVAFDLNLNSSESRELDQIQLRLGDGEEGTLKSGLRYPITTSSFSNLGTGNINIPGLTTAGSSSSLSSLLSSLTGNQATIPQVEYQDLGLTLKATPRVIRSGEVALTMDMKITALAGSSLNGVPVINNRSYSGVATVKEGAGVVLVSEVDREESRALSGTPGMSEIPGFNNAVSSKDTQKNVATLLIIITPHVIRGTQAAGQSPMMRVERGRTTQ
jgi:general secretion pathway protein D